MSTLLEQKSYSWRKNCACFIQKFALPTSSIGNTPSSDPSSPYPPHRWVAPRDYPCVTPHRLAVRDPTPPAGGGWGAGVKKTGAGVVRGNSKRLAASAPKSSSSAQAGDPYGGTAGLRGRGWWAPAYAGATTFFIAPPFLPLRYHPPRTKVVILRPYQQEKTGDPCDARARKGGDRALDLRPPFSKNTEMTTVWGGEDDNRVAGWAGCRSIR
jgi:hypothetical protein